MTESNIFLQIHNDVETDPDDNNPTTTNDTTITYLDSTPEQVHGLAKVSGHCEQLLIKNCKKAKLINDNNPANTYFYTYNGIQSPRWSIADNSDITGK